jgi:serine/threonine protein kinase
MVVSNWEGQTLGGRYQIGELLGQGGMSSVYKATDPNLRRSVAIKLIHPHLSNNPEFVRRFEEEATGVARLRHPNIIQMYDFNHEGGVYYMVMEYVAGETLQARLKRLNASGRHLPLQEAFKYTLDVCNAAGYAHQRGMIHRDIKPANVMLDVHGNAILMDFGIARMVGGQQHTATGAVMGTALYMAPEQIQGLHPDARADIYSIGVMLFEALSGRPPFEADSAMTLMMMHLNDPVPDLGQLHPGIPPSYRRSPTKRCKRTALNATNPGRKWQPHCSKHWLGSPKARRQLHLPRPNLSLQKQSGRQPGRSKPPQQLQRKWHTRRRPLSSRLPQRQPKHPDPAPQRQPWSSR